MKSQKCILVFMLMIIFVLVMANFVQATNEIGLNIIGGTNSNNTAGNNENTAPIVGNTGNDNAATNTLPQTGVAGDTALVVFAAICVLSAAYAFVRIRNYKNI